MSESFSISCCFDSHVHWLATGQRLQQLNLSSLNPDAIQSLNPKPHHFQGDWLIGYGWDESLWSEPLPPHRSLLDDQFIETPVAFSRVDGHTLWLNTAALKQVGLLNDLGEPTEQARKGQKEGSVLTDAEGRLTGLLRDQACELVWSVIPQPSLAQTAGQLKAAAERFHRGGYTHIRDMSCSEEQWKASVHLAKAGELQLHVDQFFGNFDPNRFEELLDLAEQARQEETSLLKVQGVKMFLDGALGSEGAWISQQYPNGGCGQAVMSAERLQEMMIRTWEKGFELALHTIGDAAVALAVDTAYDLKQQGQSGVLNLEHVQIARPETLIKMRELSVVCHMQPSHFLADQPWLKNKVGALYSDCFPWNSLMQHKIPVLWGSDSPIEAADLTIIPKAFAAAASAGIPSPPPVLWQKSLTHPQSASFAQTYSTFTKERDEWDLSEVFFQGEKVFSSLEI